MNKETDCGQNQILVCEDSLEGIFTGIYEAYALRIPHDRIFLQVGHEGNLRLFAVYTEIRPDTEKVQKVMRTLRSRFGEKDYASLCMALTTSDRNKAQAVYKTIVWGLSGRYKGSILNHLIDDNVRRTMELAREAGNELHHYREFLRFQELENGILHAVTAPQCDILPMLITHFADRLPMENFIIYDEVRDYYAVHPAGREWFLMSGSTKEGTEVKQVCKAESEAEQYYQELFRHFCHTISIEERKNLNLQRNMLALRFRPNMVEFTQK